MAIENNLKAMQDFIQEMATVLKSDKREAYRNRMQSIIENADITDVQKTKEILRCFIEVKNLIAKSSNLYTPGPMDTFSAADIANKASKMSTIAEGIYTSLTEGANYTIERVHQIIDNNNYEVTNVAGLSGPDFGKEQAKNFLKAVTDSTRPNHEMFEAVFLIQRLIGSNPAVRKLIENNFPDFDANNFLNLSARRIDEKQTLNSGINLSHQINSAYDKIHTNTISILSMLTNEQMGLLTADQKDQLSKIVKDLPEEQQNNITALNGGYAQWYDGVQKLLQQGYDARKIETQTANRTNRRRSLVNPLSYQASLENIINQSGIFKSNAREFERFNNEVDDLLLFLSPSYRAASGTTSTITSLPNSDLASKLLESLYTSFPEFKNVLGDEKLRSTLISFIKHNVMLNAFENTKQVNSEQRGNKKIIEALKYTMSKELAVLNEMGLSAAYEQLGECVVAVTGCYFTNFELQSKDVAANGNLYNDDIFELAITNGLEGKRNSIEISKDIRALPAYKKYLYKYAKRYGIDINKLPSEHLPIDATSAEEVPESEEVIPEEAKSSNIKKRLKSAKGLSNEALELDKGKKKDPRPPQPPRSAKDILISIYHIQAIMSEIGITNDGVKDKKVFLNCAQTRIQELMELFEKTAKKEITADPTKTFESICDEAYNDYLATAQNDQKVKYKMGKTKGQIGINDDAHIKRRDNSKKIMVVPASSGSAIWEQGEIKYKTVVHAGKEFVQYTIDPSSAIDDIPHFTKVLLKTKILNPDSLKTIDPTTGAKVDGSLLIDIKNEIRSEAARVSAGITISPSCC